MDTTLQVTAYEIVDHGQDSESYFPGCGVAFTDFDAVFTGTGNTAGEALEDAIEQAICSGDCNFTSEQSNEIDADFLQTDWATKGTDADTQDNDEWHYYVSIRVKF